MIRLDKTHFYFAAILVIKKRCFETAHTETLLKEIKCEEMQTSSFRVEINLMKIKQQLYWNEKFISNEYFWHKWTASGKEVIIGRVYLLGRRSHKYSRHSKSPKKRNFISLWKYSKTIAASSFNSFHSFGVDRFL